MIFKFYPGTIPVKISQCNVYATLFFQAFWLNAKKFQPIKILKKKAMRKTYAIIIFAGLVLGRSNTVVSN